ncbi:MAG: hypothetical protein KYX69_09410 [Sphingomonas sp.]|uniref:hypothetical protein n=1 Tax=Sphingomonas sp. TaxID=28214 RepID=UPI00262B36D1|nr:hypothetical protein [Sphingomonas sp.]MDK2767923.1 hypothetical protein [Sphingomonas sp.]
MALIAMLAGVPAVAQSRWTHTASGASLPETFEAQSVAERRDLGTPNDSVVDYEAATGTESTTLYIFKASVPNARLWFDRAMPVVASQIPMAIFEAGPVEKIAAFGSSSPTALRQIFVARQAGPFKSTALVVAQSGPWIVKVRATSATLDRAGLAARIDRHLAAIRIAPPAFAADLEVPRHCVVVPRFGTGKPVSPGVEQAAASAIVIHARLHGPTKQLCLADAANARFTLLGVTDEPSSWLLLTGDAGKAIGSEAIGTGQADTRQLVYVSTPAATRGAAVFDAPPSLEAAGGVAAPLLRDPAAGLFAISTSSDAEAASAQR